MFGEHACGLRDFIVRHGVEHVLCSFSGGKDSLVATHVAHEVLRDLGVEVEVIHADTTISLPGVQDYIRSVCDRFGWKLRIVRPEKSFFELASMWGMPTPKRRWCCHRIKLDPMISYALGLGKKNICFVTGLRRAESHRRRNMKGTWVRRIRDITIYSYDPIIDWTDEDVERYIEQHGLPVNPVYDVVGFSGECVCGAFTPTEHLIKIAKSYPEFIERFRILEKAWQEGKFKGKNYKVFYADGKKLSVDELLRTAEE